jgi:hypothetical protein
MAKFCTTCGNPIEQCTCAPAASGAGAAIMNTGLSRVFGSKKHADPEEGLKIVPELIEPCEAEIPIRQYETATTVDARNGTVAMRVQVTNKRILFRGSGMNFYGPIKMHKEFALDDIVGFDLTVGTHLSRLKFLLYLILCAIPMGIGSLFTLLGDGPALASVMGILFSLGTIAFLFFIQEKYLLKALACGLAAGTCLSVSLPAIEDSPGLFIIALFGLAMFILECFMIRYKAGKPEIDLSIKSKSSGNAAIALDSGANFQMQTQKSKGKNQLLNGFTLYPGIDAPELMRQLGAIVQDIQQLGDFGIDKWKVE